MVAEMTDEKITPSDLRAHAEVLIALEKMPSLENLLAVVAEVRAKYKPLMKTARKSRRQKKDAVDD
jgi:hypothetical protein